MDINKLVSASSRIQQELRAFTPAFLEIFYFIILKVTLSSIISYIKYLGFRRKMVQTVKLAACYNYFSKKKTQLLFISSIY